MSAQGLMVSLVILGFGLAWIILPFLKRDLTRDRAYHSLFQKEHEQLSNQYEQAISTIRELDEDNSTGKVQPDEYNRERPVWVQRGVMILKQLDQLEQEHPSLRTSARRPADQTIDDAIEAAISQYLDEAVRES